MATKQKIEAKIGRLYMELNDIEATKQDVMKQILESRQQLNDVVPVKTGDTNGTRGNKPDN